MKFLSWAGLAQMLPTGKQAMVRPGDGGRMCESFSAVQSILREMSGEGVCH